jgi:hypothetical protein
VRSWIDHGGEVVWEPSLSLVAQLVEPGPPFWLDIENPADEVIDQLATRLGLHPLAVEDSKQFGQRAHRRHRKGMAIVPAPRRGTERGLHRGDRRYPQPSQLELMPFVRARSTRAANGLSLHPRRVMACDACPHIIASSAQRACATGRRPSARGSRHGDWQVGNR